MTNRPGYSLRLIICFNVKDYMGYHSAGNGFGIYDTTVAADIFADYSEISKRGGKLYFMKDLGFTNSILVVANNSGQFSVVGDKVITPGKDKHMVWQLTE